MSLIPEHRSLIPYTTNERLPAPVPGFGHLGTAIGTHGTRCSILYTSGRNDFPIST